MKRVLLSLIITLFGVFVYAQEHVEPTEKWKVAEVWGNNYHGWAFHQDHEVDFTVENQDGRFTLTDEEVADAEYLIQKKIAYVNRDHYNQGGMCPIIDEHMHKYRRQYVGFTNDRGDHIIWLSGLWDENMTDEQLASDVILTRGGCGRFWHIKVNLNTRKVYGLEVNEDGDVQIVPRVKKPQPRISKSKPRDRKQKIRKTGIIHSPEEKVFN